MKITKNDNKINPSPNVIRFSFPFESNTSLTSMYKTMAAKRLNGISFNTVFFNTVSGSIIAVMPRIKNIENIATYNIANCYVCISSVRCICAGKFRTDVPNATTVKPITMFGILYAFANEDAASTKILAP